MGAPRPLDVTVAEQADASVAAAVERFGRIGIRPTYLVMSTDRWVSWSPEQKSSPTCLCPCQKDVEWA
jgi:hypothetical protein